MRRRLKRRLIWVYTVCSSLSVRIHMVNTVIHAFNFTNSRIQLHEFKSRIREVEFVKSWSWIREFVKFNSWIPEVPVDLVYQKCILFEFVKLNLWSWIHEVEFVQLNSWSWIRGVEIVNSWSWIREFVKLNSWIREVEFVKLKSWIREVETLN